MFRIFVTLLLLSPLCAAQDLAELQHYVHDVTVRLTSAEGQYTMPEFDIEVSTKGEINAHTISHKIQIDAALARILYGSPGEMAFVIAHEIGHILNDANCYKGQAALKQGGNLATRECEAAADLIGMQYIMAAGFDPYDAAGALGRMLMASPDQTSALAIMIGRFTSDHPVTVDRIKHLGEAAHQVCENRPEICQR